MRARAGDLRWKAPPNVVIIRAPGASAAKSNVFTPGMNAPMNSTPRARSGSAESASVKSRGDDAPACTKTRMPGASRSRMPRGLVLVCVIFFGPRTSWCAIPSNIACASGDARPALNDFGKPIVEHDCVALDEPRSKRDLRAIDPHFGADRLARENRRCEAQTHAFEARGIVSCDRLQQRAAGDAERAEAMQNRPRETGGACHFRIGMQRIVVAGEPVDQRRVRGRG